MIRDYSELKRRTEDGESCKTGFFFIYMVPAVCYDFRKRQKEIHCIDYYTFHIHPVPLHHQPGRLLPHGLRQAPCQERSLAGSGENALPVCRPGRFRRSAPGHVYFPSQNQALVFRDQYAPDPDPAGGRRHLADMAPVNMMRETASRRYSSGCRLFFVSQ